MCPLLETWPATPGMCPDWESNRRAFGSQAGTQSTEPHQPRQVGYFYTQEKWDFYSEFLQQWAHFKVTKMTSLTYSSRWQSRGRWRRSGVTSSLYVLAKSVSLSGLSILMMKCKWWSEFYLPDLFLPLTFCYSNSFLIGHDFLNEDKFETKSLWHHQSK